VVVSGDFEDALAHPGAAGVARHPVELDAM
jgi:hypothetical protein